MSATVELLREARGYVERDWTQNAFARNAEGIPVDSTSRDAVCWCAVGAMNRAAAALCGEFYFAAIGALTDSLRPGWSMPGFNDRPDQTQAVLAWLDHTIVLAEAETTP